MSNGNFYKLVNSAAGFDEIDQQYKMYWAQLVEGLESQAKEHTSSTWSLLIKKEAENEADKVASYISCDVLETSIGEHFKEEYEKRNSLYLYKSEEELKKEEADRILKMFER